MPPVPSPEQVQAQLERILASRSFSSAKSARGFLQYVVGETLAGRSDQIKEYVVGVAVFDRGDAYDPRADAVVRVEATRLRNRLREYYQGEGSADPLRIDLPRGSYVPVFQLVAGAPPVDPPLPTRSRASIRWVAAGIGVLLTLSLILWGRTRIRPLAPVRSVAVLPFANLSNDPLQDYLAEGITEGLTGELAGIRGLRVIARSAVARYKQRDRSPSAIANELKVDALAEGTVTRAGPRARVEVRILEAKTLRELGMQSYERGVSDIREIQRDAARFIADAIGAEWPPAGKAPRADVLRVKSDAYDSYLRGRFYSLRQNPDDNQTAISHLERAVSLDPSFASAYAELAQAYVWRLFLFAPTERSWEEKAFVAAEKALSMDPDLAAAHLARGRLLWTPANQFPHGKAIQEYRRALAANPSLDEARNQLALIYCHIGLFDEALEESREAARINPNNHLAAYRMAQTLAFRGEFSEALSVLSSIPPEVNPSLVGYQTAWVLFNLGRKDEAAAKISALLTDYPEDNGGLFTGMQSVLAASAGDRRSMEAGIRQAVEKGRGFGHFHHTAYHIATAYALSRQTEPALQWLEAAARDGFPCYPLFARDRNLDSLRQNARFIGFLAKLKQEWLGYNALF